MKHNRGEHLGIVLTFALTFIMLMIGVYKGIFLAYPLLFGLVLFTLPALKKGFRIRQILSMIWKGAAKTLPLLVIFVLIGTIIAMWMAGGTISSIIYNIVNLLSPGYFILFAFIACSLVSFILGTSLGTTGTIGVVFIVLARSGHVNVNLAAGAIIAGAFFGDRASPMSSSASLVAAITGTNIYRNIRNMLKTAILPFLITAAVYLYFSMKNPLFVDGSAMGKEISGIFNVSPVMLLPAVVILVLALLKVDVKLSMLCSIVSAFALAILFQHRNIRELLGFAISGFSLEKGSSLSDIIKGGGILPMIKVSIIVLVSSAYAGIFEDTGMLGEVEAFIEKTAGKLGQFAAIIITSILTSIFGCSQTLAIILTNQLVKKEYRRTNTDNSRLALDIENTAVVISPLVPWNIAGSLPAAVLMVGPGFIPYAFFLYLLPLTNLFRTKIIIYAFKQGIIKVCRKKADKELQEESECMKQN